MNHSKTKIVATIGPASKDKNVLLQMVQSGLDIARLNMSWGTFVEHEQFIKNIREISQQTSKNISIIMDLPGPRIQYKQGHGYDKNTASAITEKDKEIMTFGVQQKVDFFCVSFVANKQDILKAKEIVTNLGGQQKIIAKIERQVALDNLGEIVDVADAIMIGRGDMGNEVPLEKIPFVETEIIKLCKEKNKFVIVATQMMLTMTENILPTRAEVTDVAYAVLKNADAVMLSEESASGKHPVETVAMMEKILSETEKDFSLFPDNLLLQIKSLKALEILDSRGNPTLKVFCESIDGIVGMACVPSGASTGKYEAVELRDGNKKYFAGLGVQKAIQNIEKNIFENLKNQKLDQEKLDKLLIAMDGTKNKSVLGANAILGVSLAFAVCQSRAGGQKLFEYLERIFAKIKNENSKINFPTPMFNLLNGGVHADSGLDIQEFMIVPINFETVTEKIRVAAEIFHVLKNILKENNLSTGVGDEGGFAPKLLSNEQALELLVEAITKAGYKTNDVKIALDCAASEFFDGEKYNLKIAGQLEKINSQELLNWYENLINKYPIFSIEDPFAEDDFASFKLLKEKVGKKILIIGDDLTVTNVERIAKAKNQDAINAVLIKPNQIGTLTETLLAIVMTQKNGWEVIVSHRSGETTDTFIADLAVAVGAKFIKSGAPSRGERTAKYNRLMEIENLKK